MPRIDARLIRCLLASVLAPLWLSNAPPTAAASDPSPAAVLERALGERIVERMRSGRFPGLAVAVVDGGEAVWSRGFGFADYRERREAQADSVFRVGGLTKLVTTIAVLRLAERGRLALDAPVTRYLPDFDPALPNGDTPAITVRQLLTHHSGLPSNRLHGMYAREPATLNDTIARIEAMGLTHRPGLAYAYSNLGFDVVGALVEAVSGQSYAEHIEAAVLEPAGARHATFDAETITEGHRAVGHRHFTRVASHPVRDKPALGLWASAEDIGRIVAGLFTRERSRRLLTQESVATMFRSHNTDVAMDADLRTALAWDVTPRYGFGDVKLARLNALMLSQRGALWVAPEHELGVVVLANSAGARDLAIDVAHRAMGLMLQRRTGRDVPPPDSFKLPERIAMPQAAKPAQAADAYATALGLVRVSGKPENYRLNLGGIPLHASRRNEGWYDLRYRLFGLLPLSLGFLDNVAARPATIDGRNVLLLHFKGRALRVGTELKPQPVPQAWRQRTGRYRIVNRGPMLEYLDIETVRLNYDGESLYARLPLPAAFGLDYRLPLVPVDDDTVRIGGIGSQQGGLVQAETDSATRLHYSGYELVKVP